MTTPPSAAPTYATPIVRCLVTCGTIVGSTHHPLIEGAKPRTRLHNRRHVTNSRARPPSKGTSSRMGKRPPNEAKDKNRPPAGPHAQRDRPARPCDARRPPACLLRRNSLRVGPPNEGASTTPRTRDANRRGVKSNPNPKDDAAK